MLMQDHETQTRQRFAMFSDNSLEKIERVGLQNVSVKWAKSQNEVLSNININIGPRELVGVIGATGSGKSTLLQTILKEVEVEKGHITVDGSVSYAAQEPWIFSASIQQNILFSQDMNAEKYLKVIRVCGLDHDLAHFQFGDQTLVGERGVMISGGQKARINLARALYREADIYLLDDPLSAVDSHVAQHIFHECILDYLKEKCVILVTHQVRFLQPMDTIYVLEAGKIIDKGKYGDISLLQNYFQDDNPREASKMISSEPLLKHELQFGVKEHRSFGMTVKKVLRSFCFSAGHWSFTLLVLLLFAFLQVIASSSDYFLSFWVYKEHATKSDTTSDFFNTYNCLYIYTTLAIILTLGTFLLVSVLTKYCVQASITLHNTMLFNVVHATMSFFNNHSSGRILNRFTADFGIIDELLPNSLLNFVILPFLLLGTFSIVSSLNYWMLIPSVLFLLSILGFACIFNPTNKSLRRTEGIARSAIFTHVSASLQGLTTIRASCAQETLRQEFDSHQNVDSSACYLFHAAYHAFAFWIDITCVIYNCIVTFIFLLNESDSSDVRFGLAMTQATALLRVVQFGMKNWSDLDAQMTAVERVVEYIELPPEADDGKTILDTWPKSGNLSFQSVSLRYSPNGKDVLRNVSFTVYSGEKIGIIGRTGAGKSSLLSVLFRLFPFEGTVFIDDVDTKSLPLNILRSNISIIPQEPILFLGTLRKNLDPFNEFSDNQLYNALYEIGMKDTILKLPLGLESEVLERGSNFSVGQRQLLCLVRAMLRNNKIIVLDEATANVDLKTDELIQKTIQEKFKDSTVLTIAHRLNTVENSNKILVLDNGVVVEFGAPTTLLQNEEGFYYRYVKRNGGHLLGDGSIYKPS